MRMRPASSTIWASIIPGRSLNSARVASPLITASAASRLQSGHSDRVRRGTPVAIGTLSQLLGSELGAQDDCGSLPYGKIELMFLTKDHVALDNDLVKLAGWADIRHLHCGFAQRRDYRRLRQHGNPAEKWLKHFTLECCLRKREKAGTFDFPLVPCSLVGLRSRRKIHLFTGRETDESLRRNIIM